MRGKHILSILLSFISLSMARAQDVPFLFGITSETPRTVELVRYGSESVSVSGKPYSEAVPADKVKYAFSGKDESELEIPSAAVIDGKEYKVTGIAEKAFKGLSGVKSVLVPPSVKSIGDNAFEGSGIQSAVLSEGLEILGDEAFGYCKSLQDISLPSTLRRIGERAFIWTSLTTVSFPDHLEEIGGKAFFQCKYLRDVTFGPSLRVIGEQAFASTSLSVLSLPGSLQSLGEDAFFFTPLKWIEVEPGNRHYRSLDGVLFNDRLDKLILYPVAKAERYTIPDGVTTIGRFAFEFEYLDSYDILNHLVFPASVQVIEDFAFVSCKHLREIELPGRLTRIGTCGLYGSALESVLIDGPMPALGEDAVKPSTVFYVPDEFVSDARRRYPRYKIRPISEKSSVTTFSLDDLYQSFFGQVKRDGSLWAIREKDVEKELTQAGATLRSLGNEHRYDISDSFRYQDKRMLMTYPVVKATAIFDSKSVLRYLGYTISTDRQYDDVTKSIVNQLIGKGFRLGNNYSGAIVRKGGTTIAVYPDFINQTVVFSMFDNSNPDNGTELKELDDFLATY